MALATVMAAPGLRPAEMIAIAGGPADVGYNAGGVASLYAWVKGADTAKHREVVYADIQYVGTTAVASVEMEAKGETGPNGARFEAGWPIPSDAPTGLYSVTVRVEEKSSGKTLASEKLRGFSVYRKFARIASVKLDKTFYDVGEPISCEVTLENLTDRDLSGLRVEFSNANYPWIATYAPGKKPEEANPELALRVLRDGLTIPARGTATIPMMPAGTATFLQGQQVAVLGAGGPARHFKTPPPEVDHYTVALWDSARSVLHDMQFSPFAIVRSRGSDPRKSYSYNFTHAYNSDMDYTKYREFYPPGEVSAAITLDHSHTLLRRGDIVPVKGSVKNPMKDEWKNLELRAEITDPSGAALHQATLLSGFDLAPGESHPFSAGAGEVPEKIAPGLYRLRLTLASSGGTKLAQAETELGVNDLPSSILVFCPHEDDEHAYAGLIRAAVEAGIQIHVIVFTVGDVGACERYYSKPCGPNEAREFGMVRMEETSEALEHIGLTRDKLIFLGLPDGGSEEIWFRHRQRSDPFFSVYLAVDHSPYEDILKPNLPYARDAVIETVEELIAEYKPALIALPHPDERHVDHRTANWFVVKAADEMLKAHSLDPATIIWADISYGSGGYKPAPYHYEKVVIHLSGEAAALKEEMGWIYQSQDGNINEGMRKTYRELPREEDHLRITDWQEHRGWNE
jgi:LmbE family N-acetylglucosaminyl deacetylase